MVSLNLPKNRVFDGPAAAWKRIAAFMIDMFIIDFALFWPFERIISDIMPESFTSLASLASMREMMTSSSHAMKALTAVSLCMGLVMLLYFILFEYKMGQTAGKMVMRIYVASSQGEDMRGMKEGMKAKRQPIMLWQAIVRSIVWMPMFPFIVFWIIDPMYALFNQRSQRLLEMISRTKTVEEYESV